MRLHAKTLTEPRWWDLLAALLLVSALLTAATRLVATHWTEDLDLIQNITVLGLLIGLALGYSIFSRRVVALMGVAYGVILTAWNIQMRLGAGSGWQTRLMTVSMRLQIILQQIVEKKAVTDSAFFVTIMVVLFCALSMHAGYTLTRYGSPWKIIIPAGLAILIIQTYDPLITRRAWYLAAYLLFALLLVARLTFITQRSRWKNSRMYVPPDIGFDWIRFTLMASVAMVLFSWVIPGMSETVPAMRDAWQKYGRSRMMEAESKMSNWFSSLRPSAGVLNDYYGDNLTLGTGTPLSADPVLSIEAPANLYVGARYYWRARVYDEYVNGRWQSNFSKTEVLYPVKEDVFDIGLPEWGGRVVGDFKFTPVSNISTLYTAPQPVWSDRVVRAELSDNLDGTNDIGTLIAANPIRQGETYEMKAAMAAVTISELRAAGDDYPQWVRMRYLEVPDSVPQRVRDLAKTVAGSATNEYDIANTVTEYLRNNIQYSQVISAPPQGRDMIDWFLFDYRQGFCQYYATAEVIMLRSLGIPARMAVGYAQGEKLVTPPDNRNPRRPEEDLSSTNTYIVRMKDAHAWPEVYFPDLGWVEFEPTAAQAPLNRPLGGQALNTLPTPNPQQQAEQEQNAQQLVNDQKQADAAAALQAANQARQILILGTTSGVAILALLGVFVWKKRPQFITTPLPIQIERSFHKLGLRVPDLLSRWARYASLSPLSKAYMEINHALSRLGQPANMKDTPAERGRALVKLVPETVDPTTELLREYQYSTYSLKPADTQVARQAGKQIRGLSYRAILKRLLALLQEPTSPGNRRH